MPYPPYLYRVSAVGHRTEHRTNPRVLRSREVPTHGRRPEGRLRKWVIRAGTGRTR